MWTDSADISPLWNAFDPNTGIVTGPAPQAPAIAFIDSGINASDTADFGTRVVANVAFCSLCTNGNGTGGNSSSAPGQQGIVGNSGDAPGHSTYDNEGHGTMVAGIAAGSNPAYPGVAQNAPIVNVRVANRNGESMESDVIAACDWILANKDTYGIKVVNISMAGSSPATFQNDPLDQAVQRLWFSGVTVVAAAGNFGTGSAVDMSAAPGNDPFIITVGALDQNQSSDPSGDTVAPWSAFGFTADGFSKPDLAAPGRYLIMPVPMGSTIPTTVPDRVVAPGYMWMSGTSFASPVVAGAAAQILALHPTWTPDQVKGALMLTANYLPSVNWQAAGVGAVDGAAAATLPFPPPNPNENLDEFVSNDSTTGKPVFNSAAWASAVSSSAAWSSAAWSSAAWSSAAWASAAWASAAWSSAAWSSGTNSAMTSLATYTEATFEP
jgi:serine protease AprX